MTREEIDDMICKIMIHDGPDRHVDGHEIITDFIAALLTGAGRAWMEAYHQRVAEDNKKREEWRKQFKF